MNRVFIDKNSSIVLRNLVIEIDGSIKIPLRAIDFLIVSAKVDISLKDIATIAKNDTAILVVTTKPKEFIHIQKNYIKNGNLKFLQYQALDKRLGIAKFIVQQKIHNAYKVLHSLELDFEKEAFLVDLQKIGSIQELLGFEGVVAKRYFALYFSLFPKVWAKGKRTKHPPRDPANALLSYIYTIYYYEIATWLNYYGFEPTIGYLHTPFRSHMALASDILELFRADIDLFVARLILDKKISLQDFSKKDGIYLTQNGRKKLWQDLKIFMEQKEWRLKKSIAKIKSMIEKNSSSKLQRL